MFDSWRTSPLVSRKWAHLITVSQWVIIDGKPTPVLYLRHCILAYKSTAVGSDKKMQEKMCTWNSLLYCTRPRIQTVILLYSGWYPRSHDTLHLLPEAPKAESVMYWQQQHTHCLFPSNMWWPWQSGSILQRLSKDLRLSQRGSSCLSSFLQASKSTYSDMPRPLQVTDWFYMRLVQYLHCQNKRQCYFFPTFAFLWLILGCIFSFMI